MSTIEKSSEGNEVRNKGLIWGKVLIRFCGIALVVSSGVKFWHPAKAVAYMASMGYEGSTFFVIAVLELVSAILFLLPATRTLGLLLVSGYLGGAIAAHLAIHRFFAGGPFLVYMAHHPYIGAAIPGLLLVLAWLGVYLYRRDPVAAPAQPSADKQYAWRPRVSEALGSTSSLE